jgi:membrane protein YqaA with SNARE-associated domain
MIRLIVAVAAGAGGGFLSAFLPIINAEALVGVGSLGMSIGAALAVAFAVALGQTVGKVVIYEAARRGSGSVMRRWRRRRSARCADDRGEFVLGAAAGADPDEDPDDGKSAPDAPGDGKADPSTPDDGKADPGTPDDGETDPGTPGDGGTTTSSDDVSSDAAGGGRWRRSLVWLQRPRAAGVIVLMSASVGVPPLAVVSAAAGVAKTPRPLFALTCLTGRVLRFGVLAVLVGASTV